MTENKIKDDVYSTAAVITIENGKAVIELGETFGLNPGEFIPLQDNKIKIKKGSGSISVLNGHSII
ncbi:hypothetical protein [Crocosphaera sp. Alani8]|uniref:hypothetical protein n=1 Tax=Crocosphaera sp. Alani8 TaxID=3038952 RepID=UPI00313B0EE2